MKGKVNAAALAAGMLVAALAVGGCKGKGKGKSGGGICEKTLAHVHTVALDYMEESGDREEGKGAEWRARYKKDLDSAKAEALSNCREALKADEEATREALQCTLDTDDLFAFKECELEGIFKLEQ